MADYVTFSVEQTITLRDGREVLLRPVRPEDAADMVVIQQQVVEEAISLVDDGLDTVEERAEELSKIPDGNLYLVAAHNGRVIGSVELHRSRPALMQHQAMLSIELHRDFRGSGLGSAMIRHAVEWARHNGLEMIRLGVLDSNPRAKALYERLGFTRTGHIPAFVKRRDGTYVGDTQMVLMLNATSEQ